MRRGDVIAAAIAAVLGIPLLVLSVVSTTPILGTVLVVVAGVAGCALVYVLARIGVLVGRFWWRGSVWNRIAPMAVALAAVIFYGVGKAGPDEFWTWTLHAADRFPLRFKHWDQNANLLWWDLAVIVGYVFAGLVVGLATWERAQHIDEIDPARFNPVARRLRSGAVAGIAFVLAAAVTDLAEDALSAVIIGRGSASATARSALQGFAWAKFTLIGAAAAALCVSTAASVVRSHDLRARRRVGDLRRTVPDENSWHSGRAHRPDAAWDPPAEGGADRRGVCLSGGGIRSASFSLGALQAIADSHLPLVHFVTSVSGGGYMAAAWASLSRKSSAEVIEGAAPEGMTPVERSRPFRRRSAEERWVRHHTDYLVASPGAVAGSIVTLVAGLAVNLLLVFVVLEVVWHPVGWVIQAAHPETRANTPILDIPKPPKVRVSGVELVEASLPTGKPECEGCPTEREKGKAWRVDLAIGGSDPLEPGIGSIAVRAADGVGDKLDDRRVGLAIAPGLVVEGDQGLLVVRQPLLTVEHPEPCGERTKARCCRWRAPARRGPHPSPVDCELRVDVQPLIATDPIPEQTSAISASSTGDQAAALVDPDLVRRLIRVDRQPVVSHRSGLVGRGAIKYQAWLAWFLGILAIFWVVAFVGDGLRRRRDPGRHTANPAFGLLLVTSAFVLCALPYVGNHVSGWANGLVGTAPGPTGWPALGAFALALLPVLRRAGGWLAKRFRALNRFRGRGHVIDGLLGVLVCLIGLGFIATIITRAAANGPSGRLPGLSPFEFGLSTTDLQRWGIWTLILVVLLSAPVAAHSWSLYSIYRTGLNNAYFLRAKTEERLQGERIGYRVVRMNHGDAEEWNWSTEAQGLNGLSSLDHVEEWVVCTTANIRGGGEAAPGRSSGSFTFSNKWVGGPEVGWMRTGDYVARLGKRRRRDVSVPSTVVISGAAFSPAMGKSSRNWQGRLFALSNLRLGVWVPNPMLVARHSGPHRVGNVRRPNAAWYLRELVGWFDRTAPYLYLTDGGHWENLGLVELLRRGCTDIWMVSAAGDGPESFETTAQAMALAREELGVEFDIELEPLRARESDGEHSPRPARRLLRNGVEATPASRGFQKGTFTYTLENGDKRKGTIRVIEATLLGDLPWDVHAYGEANLDFPDIATGYQLMDHRDFEAYRMLGYTQAARALHDAHQWPDSRDPILGSPPAGS